MQLKQYVLNGYNKNQRDKLADLYFEEKKLRENEIIYIISGLRNNDKLSLRYFMSNI